MKYLIITLLLCSCTAVQIEKQHQQVYQRIADTTYPKKVEKPMMSGDYMPKPIIILR